AGGLLRRIRSTGSGGQRGDGTGGPSPRPRRGERGAGAGSGQPGVSATPGGCPATAHAGSVPTRGRGTPVRYPLSPGAGPVGRGGVPERPDGLAYPRVWGEVV